MNGGVGRMHPGLLGSDGWEWGMGCASRGCSLETRALQPGDAAHRSLELWWMGVGHRMCLRGYGLKSRALEI